MRQVEAPMDELLKIANKHGLIQHQKMPLEAHGAKYKGTRAGSSIGKAAGFSFYPAKNLGSLGRWWSDDNFGF